MIGKDFIMKTHPEIKKYRIEMMSLKSLFKVDDRVKVKNFFIEYFRIKKFLNRGIITDMTNVFGCVNVRFDSENEVILIPIDLIEKIKL